MKQPEQKQPNKRLEPVAQHDQLKPLVVPVAPEAEPTDQHFRYEPCVHEAGHAVTVYWLGGRIDERGVWVDRENGGMTNFVGGQSIRARQGLLGASAK